MTTPVSAAGPTHRPRVIVFGAGVGGVDGIGAAYELTRDGLAEVTVLEKVDSFGGIWQENTYPGAACDVPSHRHSYSFSCKADRGRRYAEQPDLVDYIHETAERFDVRDLVRTGVEVTSTEFDEDSDTWGVRSTSGEMFEVDVLIPAMGQLSRPAFPAIQGLNPFAPRGVHPCPGLVPAMRGAIWETTELISLALTSARPLARILTVLARANLRLTLRDPELRAALTPDKPIGCERMLASND